MRILEVVGGTIQGVFEMNTLAFIGLLASIGIPLYILSHIHIFMNDVEYKLKGQDTTNRYNEAFLKNLDRACIRLEERVEVLEAEVKKDRV